MPRKPRLWQFRFSDMLDASNRIVSYAGSLTASSLAKDQKTLDALVRCFEILGEAASQVPKDVQARYPQLPWREMTAMRNELIHGYFELDPEVLLLTVSKNVRPLIVELERILERIRPSTGP